MKIRVARHTANLKRIEDFYIQILGLEKIGFFQNHEGYDGVFIGRKDLDWHLEFTTSDEFHQKKFDSDNLLVFYPDTEKEYALLIKQIEHHKIQIVKANNPYWNSSATVIQDPDGFYIAIYSPQ